MSGPLLHGGASTRRLMWQVVAALAPACAAAVWRQGVAAAAILGAAVAAAVAVDLIVERRIDGSCVITGLLLALMLPAGSPWWLAAVGGALAVGLGKHLFGGLGANLFNPAAMARAVLMGLAPGYLFLAPADGVTGATALAVDAGITAPTWTELFLGAPTGALASAAPLAVLAGGLLLIALRTIDWRVPLTYLAALTLFALLLPPGERASAHAPWLAGNPLLHLLAGGSLLAAFFLLTDPVTSPWSPGGRICFAVFAAALTMLIRLYGQHPDGVVLGVLVANAATPLIDWWTVERPLNSPGRAPERSG